MRVSPPATALPAFTIRLGQDFPNLSDGQIMTTTCFTGELPGLEIAHGCNPSVYQHNKFAIRPSI
jgi:hypothetical protein